MEEVLILIPKELLVYERKRNGFSDNETVIEIQKELKIDCSVEDVQRILSEIAEKDRRASLGRVFYQHISKHLRIFKLVKDHYTEEGKKLRAHMCSILIFQISILS